MKFKPKEIYNFQYTSNYGDWRLFKTNLFLVLTELNFLLKEKKLLELKLDEIAWRGKNISLKYRGENCICCGGKRYEIADTSIPLVVLIDSTNPMNKPYTLLDGKHRAEKMLIQEIDTAKCYVFTLKEISPFLLTEQEFFNKINSSSLGS